MSQKERMEQGLPFLAGEESLRELRLRCRKLLYQFNNLEPEEFGRGEEILRQLLGASGERFYIEPPFRCDYGYNIHVGNRFYANFNLVILDIAQVTIGERTLIGPNVAIYTVGHPLHPERRAAGHEFGMPVRIGDNVWLGGNVVVNPGVSIGNNAVVGSGSVVTRDIPDNVLALGNPARVLREITEADRDYYHKDLKFDF